MAANLSIISYRKLSFARAFGFTVRDLMFLRALDGSSLVSKIHWFERPDVGPEIFARTNAPLSLSKKVEHHAKRDFSIIGPIVKRRGWTAKSFDLHERDINNAVIDSSDQSVLLDFSPFYIPPESAVKNSFYWYDLIDNFTLHNRFSQVQIDQVKRKYEFVEKHASLVTGVTNTSVKSFSRGACVPNRLLKADWGSAPVDSKPDFDFGFLGFITDKLDLSLLERLGAMGYSTMVGGLAYDEKILERLKQIPNVAYIGKFSAHQAPALTRRFHIGLVPYLPEKMHNESPIKFFQYIATGRPSMLSTTFNEMEANFGEYIHYYDDSDEEIRRFYSRMTANFEKSSSSIQLTANANQSMFWEDSIDDILRLALT